jgi:hypothetical protein
MRKRSILVECAALVFGLAGLSPLRAQPYSIDWFKVAGGGGTSTNGQYGISGTAGQADSGTMTGGNYAVDGGFWGIIAPLQTPGAPTLRLVVTATNTLVITWLAPSTGFTLQHNAAISNASWTVVTNAPVVVDSENQVALPRPPGNHFYRLTK